jgi:hypothetical protein
MLPTIWQMEKTHAITRERSPEDDRQTVIAARGANLANMTITTLTTK